jgi:hypothetical protein
MRDVEDLDLRVERLEHCFDVYYKEDTKRHDEHTKRHDELAQGLAALTQAVRALQSAQQLKQTG